MSKLDDRLKARQQTATANAQAASRPATATDDSQHAEEPATAPPAPAQPQRGEAPAPERPALSKAEERRILHRLGAAAGKLAAVLRDLSEAEQAWAYEVTDARQRGLDERKVMGAALTAGVDLPATE